MDSPTVSVVMCARNEEQYIRAAVESILQQTYENLELIVVDDGSTDGTLRILAELPDDPRLRVFQQSPAGPYAARNRGIAQARGEFITFMDADDLCDPRRIERQVAFLAERSDLAGVGTWETLLDRHGEEIDRVRQPCDPEEIRGEYARGRMALNGMSVMIRSKVLRQVGGFREQFQMAGDFDLWLRVTQDHRMACIPEYLYGYRLHPGMGSLARKQRQARYTQIALDLYAERIATGSDRLQRGEKVEFPDDRRERGKSTTGSSEYRRALAWHYGKRSRELARSGHWGPALRFAARGWWSRPSDRAAIVLLLKTGLATLLPFLRPRFDSFRSLGRVRRPSATSLQATLVSDIDELAAASEEWDRLLVCSETPSSFFLSSTCIVPFWRHHGGGRTLATVLVRAADGELVGAGPFYCEIRRRGLLRHRRLALLGSPESGADYLDVLALPGYRRAVLSAVFACLREGHVRWDRLNLNFILDDSPTPALLADASAGQRFWIHRRPSSTCPYAKLPATWEEFVSSLGASTRRGIRYQENLLRRKFADVRFEQCDDEREVPDLMQTLIRYKQAKYGHRFDGDYLAWTDQAIEALRKDMLRFFVLRLDGHPACLWLTFLFQGRVFFQACSYDPDNEELRLGKVLMAHAMQSAIEEGAREYDMKRGTAPYKYHWANAERRTIEVEAIRWSLRGAAQNLWEYGAVISWMRRGVERLDGAARHAARRLLLPVAERWPGLLPARLRHRLLRRAQGEVHAESGTARADAPRA